MPRRVFRPVAIASLITAMTVPAAPVGAVTDETLFYARGRKVFAIEADGTGKVRLFTAERGRTCCVSVSPDGAYVMFTDTVRGGSLGLKVAATDGSSVRTVAPKRWQVGSWTWAGDGSRLIFSAYRKDRRGVYIANADGTGRTRIYTKPIGGEAVLNHDGTLAAFTRYGRSERGRILVWRASDGSVSVLPVGDLDASGPAFSPAEDDLIFFAFVQVPGGSRYPVYRVGADGSSLVELSPPGASVGNAQWSPDGSMIAYSTCCSEVGAADEIHVVNEDGSDDRVLVTDSDSGNRESSLSLFPFSPEGTTIAFEDYAYNEDNFRPIYNRISTVDLAGSVAIHSTDPDVFFQQWSADGSRFVACEFSNEGIEGALSFALGQATGVDLLPVCDLDWDRRDNPYGP